MINVTDLATSLNNFGINASVANAYTMALNVNAGISMTFPANTSNSNAAQQIQSVYGNSVYTLLRVITDFTKPADSRQTVLFLKI